MSFKDNLDIPEIEAKWQKIWNASNIYKWDSAKSKEEIFSIDTPPPTVSGELHMGHVFSYTQADFIARFQRMSGKSVFYPIGFDDNGLPTERLVEKVKKIRAKDLSREEFIKVCEEVVLETEEKFRNIYKSLGLSFDWEQEYQTISSKSRKLSQMSFIDLYNKKKIIRKFGPSFWDIKDQTAIAQAENVDKEQTGILNDIKFKTVNGEEIVIATTRPEMLPACVAIFYHPNDDRYQHLKNTKAIIPFFNNQVPILLDEDVEQEKGTGLVMCCTFGDIQDIEWWRKHKLNTIECIDLHGKMKNAGFLDGAKITEARELIIEKLKSEQLLLEQTEVVQNVKCAERSGGILEIIPTYQWYIEVLPYKADLHRKNDECNWHPKFMKDRLSSWIDGLNQDWCISRQRYFGVPFPVWYSKRKGEEGKILVANVAKLPVDPYVDLPDGYTRQEVKPETDVMDTWATSAITPQLSSHGISEDFMLDKDRHNKLFPYDLRPQAHEIIRTWAFGTLVKSFFHQDSIPWKNLMISGWCLASDKSKMSKSKGNVVTPEKLIKDQGADVIRYWASSSKLGMDIVYSDQIFKIGKKLVTKLWNAGKFVDFHINGSDRRINFLKDDINNKDIFCDLDLWIISSLYKVVENATNSFKNYEYCDARVFVENFFWNDFCDNYLELVKTRVYDEENKNPKEKKSAILTLNYVFNTLLKLFAPYMPHVTEELNSILYGKNNEMVNQINMWPKLDDFYYSADKLNIGTHVLNILELVRKYKSTKELSLRSEINEIYFSGKEIGPSALLDLKNACNSKEMKYLDNIEQPDLRSNCGKYSILVL
ncbi:valine--tRNA ligase [Candidatus Bandiella numerosa]|uniref:valine--tRNA ligase n=1 Tax=Candidatus Bandiella numerosa TaxID=2570586 RepID=UPI001F214567|nr:valine--tRNA ligase [Candidatus Bandiella numerosa]